MLETIKHIDTEIFIFLNGLHNGFFDFIMYWLSNKLTWIPLYALLIFLLIRTHRKNAIWILLFIAITITLSDQLSVMLKNMTMRPRPCHEEAIASLVHIVKGKCGGSFGFVSSHASNHFALAIFLLPFLGPHYRYFNALIILWATSIAYSRIYLGVHYPVDILGGSLLGILIGYTTSFMCLRIIKSVK